MGRIVSFVVVILIVVAKYFIFKYLDDKKVAEEVEKSKTVWVESFKTEYMANCTRPGEDLDPNVDMQIYCECVAERTQAAAAFPTVYDPDKFTSEQYQDELAKLSDAYFASEVGKKNTDECSLVATKKQ